MINLNDSIRYANVVSMSAMFHYSKMKEELEKFKSIIQDANLHTKGPLIYALLNIPLDENMIVDFYMPIEEDSIKDIEGLRFDSYLEIENMMSIIVVKNPEQDVVLAYSALIECMKAYKFKQMTPMFHVIETDKDYWYMQIKVGYIEEDSMI